jgi:anti-sigma regulatory factor (Ser/Thr protein kinase)
LSWDEERSGRAALLATEIGTNLVKHARDASLIVVADASRAATRLQLIAVDHGPGMDDVEACMRDGYSTAGSAGTGLGAIRRMASSLDIFSTASKGTVLVAELLGPAPRDTVACDGYSVGGVCIPCPGETVSGDAWDYATCEGSLFILVCDGLGHGLLAAEASRLAVAAFRKEPGVPVTQSISRIHDALRATRGAAAAVATIDRRAGQVRFCGVGNIAGSIVSGSEVRHLVSHNGILGNAAPRIAEFSYPWNDSCHLAMHSDGISGRWRVDDSPGLWRRSPSLIAGVLCRDWIRERDDATAVIARPT